MTDPNTPVCQHPEAPCAAVDMLSALREQLANLQQQVITDPLTQLYNKRHFSWALETEMERTRRSLHATSLILLDLDHFKTINDNYGHAVGDRVLIAAASLIKSELRMIDIPCRYGGEEFAVILPSTPLLTALQVAERLRATLANSEIDTEKGRLTVTSSFGVAAYYSDQKATPITLVERADQKLYEAKNLGRNRVCAETQAPAGALSEAERTALFDDREPE